MAQKIQICIMDDCMVAASVGISQLISQCLSHSHVRSGSQSPPPADVISDLSLVVLPIYLLRRTKIINRQRIMIFSAFSASLLITAVTILHSIVLLTMQSSGSIVIGHAKVSHVRSVIPFLGASFKGGSGAEMSMPLQHGGCVILSSSHPFYSCCHFVSDSRGIRGDRRRSH
jgi:hypothetical protein